MKRLVLFLAIFFPVEAHAATSIPLTINMSEAVTVTGTPRVAVDVGGQTRYATYTSGSGTNALTFTLSPQSGDVDLDGITVSTSIDLNGGTIQDVGGNSLSSLAFTPPSTNGIKINYPSLAMDFVYDADGRYTLNGMAYNDLTSFLSATGGSFTRASIGTYYDSSGLMHTASSNVPRFDWDPVTHAPKGILIEASRTNYILRSSDLSSFASATHTVSPSPITAPDGTMASQVVFASGTAANTGRTFVSMVAAAGEAYTFSVWVGAVSGYPASSSFGIYSNVEGWGLDANSTAEIIQGPGSLGFQIGGLFRVSGLSTTELTKVRITRTLTSASSIAATVYPNTSSAQTTAGNVYWGAQLEKGAFITSYIPTSSVAVTRAADILNIPTSSWYSNTSGTMFVSVIDNRSAGLGIWASLGSVGSSVDRCQMYSSGTSMMMQNFIGNVSQVAGIGGSRVYGTNKAAYALESNNFAYVSNGGAVGINTTGSLGTKTLLTLGRGADYSSDVLNDHVLQFKYYPARVPNVQLQLMTQ